MCLNLSGASRYRKRCEPAGRIIALEGCVIQQTVNVEDVVGKDSNDAMRAEMSLIFVSVVLSRKGHPKISFLSLLKNLSVFLFPSFGDVLLPLRTRLRRHRHRC